jgi:transcription-repair coupling factor (superfamily II helicase)
MKTQLPPGDTLPLFLLEALKQDSSPILVVTSDPLEAQRLPALIQQLNPKQTNCHSFPSWETLPYDRFSPHADLTSDRLSCLLQLKNMESGCAFVAANTLLYRLMPRQHLEQHAHLYRVGMQVNLTQLIKTLTQSGYNSANTVYEHGDFANRGSLLDIFPMGSKQPIRLDFFDDEIESIRLFDPETQRTTRNIDSFKLLPAEEYPLDEEGIQHFRQAWRDTFPGNPMDAPIYQSISEQRSAAGAEYYLPLFYDKLNTLFDYLPENTRILLTPKCMNAFSQSYDSLCKRYESLRYDQQHPLCKPRSIALDTHELNTQLEAFRVTQLQEVTEDSSLPEIRIDHRNLNPLKRFTEFLTGLHTTRVIVCAETAGRKTVLLDLLRENKLDAVDGGGWEDAHAGSQPLVVIAAALQLGFESKDNGIVYITEQELFGSKQAQLQREDSKQKSVDPNSLIRNLVELNTGDPVVHRQHGIALYRGLTSLTTDGVESEYLLLEYANSDKLYVPVVSLQCITRYLGADAEHAPVSRLGSGSWEQATEKAKKRIKDIAAELLVTYSQREHSKGFAFNPPNAEFLQFRTSFPFTETPDQRKTIDGIIDNMVSDSPMDRLVCGDVGFGKTEVAMQAAFLAIQSHKQVVVLAPTTLLANQHMKNFQDRFADWPIRIALCSRAVAGKALTEMKTQLGSGSLDIVIGTHKLLNPEIQFKDLGLLIVDEEHRFGVSHKEKIKAMRNNIDILTMTATPIPRTLNMALSKMRDLSIIATPPSQRLAIKTFIRPYRSELIKESIERELSRGGQVYFLHNDIATMPRLEESLQELIPGLRTVTAHGQMSESHLERIMTGFCHQQYQVLITTTIIESGIDVPNANTILINNADKFGLAQLHQLRGRVGRSHHQAYAFLLTDPHRKLRPDAKKRLEALELLTDLGSGFALAMQDLEIRGAGELLGDDQSGHIQKIGFSLYLELLDEAMQSLNAKDSEAKPAPIAADVDLGISTLLTADYVHDVSERLTLYKRLASSKHPDTVDSFKGELIDRFGPLNPAGNNLIGVTKLTLLANSLGIKKIRSGREYGLITFTETADINHQQLIKLIQLQPKNYQLQKQTRLRYRLKDGCLIQQCQDILTGLKT